MNVGYIQFDTSFGEVDKNISRALTQIDRIEADLIVLPELFSQGYAFKSRTELENLAEKIPSGPTSQAIMEKARSTDTHIVYGIAERNGSCVYNSAVLARSDGLHEVYRKTHLFGDETFLFDKGGTGFNVFDIEGIMIGIMICFDWIFPESARVLALKGAQIICHPANLILPYCPDAMITRSIENRVFTITSNRVGEDPWEGKSLRFIGKSQVTSPRGEILIRAPEKGEHTGIVEIDPEIALNKNITSKNNLFKDRRTELYQILTEC